MFSDVLKDIRNNIMPDTDALMKRFDFALTKKLGIVTLPPPFWMQDPKINPRTDHLFWASLLLMDRKRIDQAISVLVMEQEQRTFKREKNYQADVDGMARKLIRELLSQFTDENVRKRFEKSLCKLVPEWLTCGKEACDE